MTRFRSASIVFAAAVVALAVGVAVAPASAAPPAPKTAPAVSTVARTSATVTPSTIRSASNKTVFAGGLFTDPNSEAARAATALAGAGRPTEATAARTIAAQPVATWLGSWFSDAQLVSTMQRVLTAAEKKGSTPVFVTYNVPNRDCGSHSAGGAADNAAYLRWNGLVASTLAGRKAVVIVEPDALALISTCPDQATGREATLAAAVGALADKGVPAYLDAGNSNWVPPQTMATRLTAAGVDRARGFATNVSNYYPVDAERAYAEQVSKAVGGARYVIDTSRNGRGWKGAWCNAPGAGLGGAPHVTAGTTGLDALLWIKTPGASDGRCNGGPAAGVWFPSYAVQLVANRKVG